MGGGWKWGERKEVVKDEKRGEKVWAAPLAGGRRTEVGGRGGDIRSGGTPTKKAAVGTGTALLLPLVVDEGDGPVDQVKKQDEQGHHGSRQVRRQL